MEQLSFDKFINTINKEPARDLVRSINLFMKGFRARPPDSESDSKAVQEFLSSMEVAFAQHPLWAGTSREDLDAASEGLEKYLMTKLYDRTFGADALDRERDIAVAARLQALQFVRPEHLEIAFDFASDSSLLLAQKELARINMFKSPRDKLVCVLSCCKVVNNLLASKKYGAGADDFTPVLIYVTIRAAPEALASNLAFIERYRMASKLVSEAQYFFVQMQSAVAFVETLDVHSSLKVDPDELIAHMLAAGALTDTDLVMMQKGKARSREASVASGAEPVNGAAPSGAPRSTQEPTHVNAAAVWPQQQQSSAPQHHSTGSVSLLDLGPDSGPTEFGSWTGQPGQQQQQQQPTMVEVVDNFQHRPYANSGWAVPGSGMSPPPPPPPDSPGVPYVPQQQQQQQGGGVRPPLPPPPPSGPGHARTPSYDLFSSLAPPPPPPPPPPLQSPQSPPMYRNFSQKLDYYQPDHSAQSVPPPPPVASQGSGNGYQPPATAAAWGQQPAWGRVPSGSSPRAPPAAPPPPPPPRVPPPPPVPKSVADLEAEGARLILASHRAGSLQGRYPLLYAPADLLSLGQVRQLVACYKELALKYEALSLAVDATQQQYRAEQESHRAQMTLYSQAAAQGPSPPQPAQPPPSVPNSQWQPPQPVTLPLDAPTPAATATATAAPTSSLSAGEPAQQPTPEYLSFQAIPQPTGPAMLTEQASTDSAARPLVSDGASEPRSAPKTTTTAQTEAHHADTATAVSDAGNDTESSEQAVDGMHVNKTGMPVTLEGEMQSFSQPEERQAQDQLDNAFVPDHTQPSQSVQATEPGEEPPGAQLEVASVGDLAGGASLTAEQGLPENTPEEAPAAMQQGVSDGAVDVGGGTEVAITGQPAEPIRSAASGREGEWGSFATAGVPTLAAADDCPKTGDNYDAAIPTATEAINGQDANIMIDGTEMHVAGGAGAAAPQAPVEKGEAATGHVMEPAGHEEGNAGHQMPATVHDADPDAAADGASFAQPSAADAAQPADAAVTFAPPAEAQGPLVAVSEGPGGTQVAPVGGSASGAAPAAQPNSSQEPQTSEESAAATPPSTAAPGPNAPQAVQRSEVDSLLDDLLGDDGQAEEEQGIDKPALPWPAEAKTQEGESDDLFSGLHTE